MLELLAFSIRGTIIKIIRRNMKREAVTINEKLKYYYILYKYRLLIEILPKLKSDYERLRYVVLEVVDSSPKKKRKEHDLDWYKRIDLKYALRHARCMYFMSRHTNAMCQRKLKLMEFGKYPKKIFKKFNELTREVAIVAYKNEQNYNNLLERKGIEEKIGES